MRILFFAFLFALTASGQTWITKTPALHSVATTEPISATCGIDSVPPLPPYNDFVSVLSTNNLDPNDIEELINIAVRGLGIDSFNITEYEDGEYELSGFYLYEGESLYFMIKINEWNFVDNVIKISVTLMDLQGCQAPICNLNSAVDKPIDITVSAITSSSILYLINPLQQNGTQPFNPFRLVRNLSNELTDYIAAGDGDHKCICCNSGGPIEGTCTTASCDESLHCSNNSGVCKWINVAGSNHTVFIVGLITLFFVVMYILFNKKNDVT